MIDEISIDRILDAIEEKRHLIDNFRNNVVHFFAKHPKLTSYPPVIHSVKSRLKTTHNLRKKIKRKFTAEDPITPENVFDRLTDIAGVRVLHLYQAQFSEIHQVITEQLNDQEWMLFEPAKAYTWDPGSQDFFVNQSLNVEVKESLYTSIHYVIKPREDSPVSCEIQVRTLFEEIWGEIDHLINYPEPTNSVACREQIGVLARLVGAGSRLADSIHRTHSDEKTAHGHSNR